MGAITPSAATADTVHGQQFLQGGQILVLPFTTDSTANPTWTVPPNLPVVSVAWYTPITGNPVSVTYSSVTRNVTFNNDGLAAYSGSLILVYGGRG